MGSTNSAGVGGVPAHPGGSATQRRWWAGHEDALPEGLGWLSDRERARLDPMRFRKRRTEYLLRRWAGKRAVAATLGLDADPTDLARIEVLNRVTGAPYVAIDGAVAPWEISLSDRAGCAVALVGTDGTEPGTGVDTTLDTAVGIDLEVVEPRSEGFVTDFLTSAEQDWVRGPAAADPRLGRDAAANLVWSATEAALKVLRVGLRADTRSVEVTVESDPGGDGWARFTARHPGGSVPGWWRRDGVFLLTVAAGDDLDPPSTLPGSLDLALATPVHHWVDRPVVTPGE